MWTQLVINAFSLGSFYALIAFGFALIFGITRAFNLAHGELIILSGYLAYGLIVGQGWPFWAVFPVCMTVLALACVLLYALFRCLGAPFELNSLVVSFGIALILQNLMLLLFSADYRLIPASGPPLEVNEWALSLSRAQGLLVALSLLATGGLYLLLNKTFLGKALRATIQQREAARLAGIRVERMGLTAFVLGGVLIGMAGPLYGQNAYLHPSGGTEPTLVAIIITIFAGTGRIRTILLGGWLLGFLEALTTMIWGGSWKELVSAVILILLLLKWPRGLFEPERLRTVP